MQWSSKQDQALKSVSDWLKNGNSQVFRLFGYAGTGKTTLAKELAATAGRVAFGAYTGKAASVLQDKGCPASTIHQLIYLPAEKSKAKLRDLQRELSALKEDDPKATKINRDIEAEKKRLKQPAFVLNPDSELNRTDLLIIDECSMVDERMGTDLLSFGCPVLVLGDPAQLPPVRGSGYFTDAEPDIMLDEIHRQAEGNPIIELATKVRLGEDLQNGSYGESLIIDDRPDPELVMSCDQILVGRNKTRKSVNNRVRGLLGLSDDDPRPVVGDKLVCLKNNHEEGLLNGTLWKVDRVDDVDYSEKYELDIYNENQRLSVEAHNHYFRGEEPDYYLIREAECFDYGYALTTHKAQGSQWPSVFIFDESACFRANSRNWLYTAITRAAERVVISI